MLYDQWQLREVGIGLEVDVHTADFLQSVVPSTAAICKSYVGSTKNCVQSVL